MNIIIYRYNSICEPDYIDAFRKVGIEVIEDKDGMDGSIDIDSRLTKLGNMIAEYKPVFIFSINYFPFLSILCDRLHILYVAVSVDCPVFEIFHNSIKNSFNRLFLFDRRQYLSICNENPSCIFHLPLGAPCERNKLLLGENYNPEYDISFVGSLYKEKDPFLDLKLPKEFRTKIENMINKQILLSCHGFDELVSKLTDEDIKTVREAADKFLPSDECVMNMDKYVVINDYIAPHMAYLERVKIINELADSFGEKKVHLFTRSDTSDISEKVALHDGVKSLTEMPFVFRNSKINLNISLRSIQTGLPQRIWDILSCRGFLITNDQEEIFDFFEAGVHLETYSSLEELKDKIRYYLDHNEDREEIANKGYEEACERHTTMLRVIEIIKTCLSTMEQ